jgi:CIC family chloride channel protein
MNEQENPKAVAGGPEADRPAALPVLSHLHGYRIVDLEIGHQQALASHCLADVAWPAHSLVIAVRREGSTFVPQGSTRLSAGDRLTVLVPAEHADTLVDLVLREGSPQPAPEAAKVRP